MTDAMNENELLTPAEAAERLRVSVSTMARWRSQQVGPPYVRLGKSKRSPIRYLPLTFTDSA